MVKFKICLEELSKTTGIRCWSGDSASVQRMDPAHFEYETGLINFQTGLVVAQWLDLFSRNQSDSDIGWGSSYYDYAAVWISAIPSVLRKRYQD